MGPSSPFGIPTLEPSLNESWPSPILKLTNPTIYYNNIIINIVDMIKPSSSTQSKIDHMVQILNHLSNGTIKQTLHLYQTLSNR
jgi:hypothetical protein